MSRNKILANIRKNIQITDKIPLPEPIHVGRVPLIPTPHNNNTDINHIQTNIPNSTTPTSGTGDPDLRTSTNAFIDAVKNVGGECIILKNGTAMSGSGEPDLREYFDGTEPTILHAHFGVIENGACWIDHHPEDDRTRYTLPEHLAILLPHNALVPTMHEAYARIEELGIDDFGLFLSGPSKTADIEQALVIGAQGAISTKVFLV